tara:strand:- start:40414 stop:41715 length:1302 start_codon:yes stop_codon:yes gene_type:complete
MIRFKSPPFKLFYLLIFIIFGLESAAALKIQITDGNEEPINIAIVPFYDESMSFPFHEVITSDLEFFGEFSVLRPEFMLSLPIEEQEVYFRDWKLLAVDYLVIGQVISSNQEEFQISYKVFDIARKKNIHDAIITGSSNSLKRISHNISDKIYKKINGLEGIFSTRILYIDKPDILEDLYRLRMTDIDGENDISLFSSSQPLMSPSWSPNGESISYVSFEEGSSRIVIQELSSGRRTLVKKEKGINSSPNWSPDGKYLAAVLSSGGNPDIYLYNLKRKSWKQITFHQGIDTEPDWSPKGRSLIFTSNRSGSPQIYEINLRTERIKRKTFEGTYNARARYLPDGKGIVFVHRKNGIFHIASQNLRSGKINILSDTDLDESPTISPNGNVILYSTKNNTNDVLAGITIDGKMKFILPSSTGDAREPSWSPYLDKN